jgi:hypothetical protein
MGNLLSAGRIYGPGLKRNTPLNGVSDGESAGLTNDQAQPEQQRADEEMQDPGAESQGGQHGKAEGELLQYDLFYCFTGMGGHVNLPFGNENGESNYSLFCQIYPSRQVMIVTRLDDIFCLSVREQDAHSRKKHRTTGD